MLLSAEHLSINFGSRQLLEDVNFYLNEGDKVGVIGINGTGKSTFLKVLAGRLEADAGTISRNPNVQVSLLEQNPPMEDDATVLEQVFLHFPKEFRELNEYEAKTMLNKLGLPDYEQKVGTLSGGQRKRVALAAALIHPADVLILDEPTSSLTANEVESLFRIMRELKEQGVALVYISHKMDEIKVIADEVTIMRDGHYIGKWDVANMTKEQIIAKMVGRELSNLFPPLENHPSDEVMMKVEDFTSIHPRSFRHCSFELKKGEILGVAGLVGAQRTELMEGIFGLRAHTAGKVWIKGEEVEIKQPRDAIRKSVALLTEDRRATGIMGVLSVADNISIASLDALRKGPIMLDDKKILNLVATNKEKMAIKVPSPKTAIKSLSGGNQQKVLIARWLANNPDVLILDEPTRGIDVGAKYEIYCIIADLAKQGKSIIMISSEMSEIIGMSNRVMVMCDGRITGFIDGKDATQENIMALATQFETAPTTAAANQ